MNDEETVALTVGGHTFGKMHGAVAEDFVGAVPEGAGLMAPGHRMGQQPRDRLRRVHDHVRPRGRLDAHADEVGQHVLGHDLRPRVGAGRVAGRRQAVAAPRGARRASGCPTPTSRASSTRRRCRRPTWPWSPTRHTSRSPSGSTRTPISSPTPSRAPGSSCSIATWARPSATSARRSRASSCCGRTTCRRTRAR